MYLCIYVCVCMHVCVYEAVLQYYYKNAGFLKKIVCNFITECTINAIQQTCIAAAALF